MQPSYIRPHSGQAVPSRQKVDMQTPIGAPQSNRVRDVRNPKHRFVHRTSISIGHLVRDGTEGFHTITRETTEKDLCLEQQACHHLLVDVHIASQHTNTTVVRMMFHTNTTRVGEVSRDCIRHK